MKKEFNLSEKKGACPRYTEDWYLEEDVKEFIKLLKEEMIYTSQDTEIFNKELIDKLAGDDLK